MNINNSEELEKVIIELEKRKVVQENNLRLALQTTLDSLKPTNLIKATLHEVTHSSDIRNSAIRTAAGIGIGLLTKDMFIGKAIPVLRKIIGSALESRLQDGLKSTGKNVKAYSIALLSQFFGKKKNTIGI